MATSFLVSFRQTIYYPLFILFFFMNVALSVFFAVGLLGELKIYTNISGSMSPTIVLGDLTVVKKQYMNSYKPGDIITFFSNRNGKQEVITHRIYRMGGNVYITKGDNNITPDTQPVIPRLIIGKVIAIIPYLGYWVMAGNSLAGKVLFIIMPMFVIISTEVFKIKQSSVMI
ncbi:MAG: Signal peptidase I [Candidatus Roizmanbacteria bacterium GW2011_GWA2_37_7]|uniref:Signal peptidase I n=1 Tax=Candidatus Roizmanbacteria bacterium GW2011_GWA2_37_7 TaxID=1618481 RepID=A0A0G0H148_9BACT|nr:MAG: Signal peptidase I [Candidatus Roizmanbacteria bacterium GW2011_GWA2_37_7]